MESGVHAFEYENDFVDPLVDLFFLVEQKVQERLERNNLRLQLARRYRAQSLDASLPSTSSGALGRAGSVGPTRRASGPSAGIAESAGTAFAASEASAEVSAASEASAEASAAEASSCGIGASAEQEDLLESEGVLLVAEVERKSDLKKIERCLCLCENMLKRVRKELET